MFSNNKKCYNFLNLIINYDIKQLIRTNLLILNYISNEILNLEKEKLNEWKSQNRYYQSEESYEIDFHLNTQYWDQIYSKNSAMLWIHFFSKLA